MKKVNLGTALLMSALSAGVALLLAPKSGKELQKDLKQKAREAKWEAELKARELKEDFKEAYSEAEKEINIQEEVDRYKSNNKKEKEPTNEITFGTNRAKM